MTSQQTSNSVVAETRAAKQPKPSFGIECDFVLYGTKMVGLRATQHGADALGLWVMAGGWCFRHQTDGLLPKGELGRFGYDEEHVSALIAAGLWADEDGWFRFVDWGTAIGDADSEFAAEPPFPELHAPATSGGAR